ncbi:hypothetical protein AAY86_10570 [Pseudomonas amygdali pv. tabaci str. ATCC 11528]|nr:hypothetical protein C1E_0225755 [Pseudomonas amygdali pv. tabaci str. ATCC 11528]KKY52952.1 hypothetical protein AAY86_10570 [Pseudomonas amygdali pv. tabaci str. ATCC 11528]
MAGIHYPDTTDYLGDLGITDVTDRFADLGWSVEGQRLFMADHYRAAADMMVRWALSESIHCSVEIDDWFPSRAERQRLLEILDIGRSKLSEVADGKKWKRGYVRKLSARVVANLDGAWCQR